MEHWHCSFQVAKAAAMAAVCRQEKYSPASWPSRQFQKPPRLQLLFAGDVETVETLPLDVDGGKMVSVGGRCP